MLDSSLADRFIPQCGAHGMYAGAGRGRGAGVLNPPQFFLLVSLFEDPQPHLQEFLDPPLHDYHRLG